MCNQKLLFDYMRLKFEEAICCADHFVHCENYFEKIVNHYFENVFKYYKELFNIRSDAIISDILSEKQNQFTKLMRQYIFEEMDIDKMVSELFQHTETINKLKEDEHHHEISDFEDSDKKISEWKERILRLGIVRCILASKILSLDERNENTNYIRHGLFKFKNKNMPHHNCRHLDIFIEDILEYEYYAT